MHSLAPGFLLGSFFAPAAGRAPLTLAIALLAAAAALRSATYIPAPDADAEDVPGCSPSVLGRFMSPPPTTSSWNTVRWIFRPDRLLSTVKSAASTYRLVTDISVLTGCLRGTGALPSLRGRPLPRFTGGCCCGCTEEEAVAASFCCCRRSWACILASVSLLEGRPGPLFLVIMLAASSAGSLALGRAGPAAFASASFFLRFSQAAFRFSAAAFFRSSSAFLRSWLAARRLAVATRLASSSFCFFSSSICSFASRSFFLCSAILFFLSSSMQAGHSHSSSGIPSSPRQKVWYS
mmetsp:Transcript_32586/g.69413  ORF Transcript_32586/g.69413 Transcript_32586/m.69413 type:complete len:293 (-) Transcript_32586:419-1297(-)